LAKSLARASAAGGMSGSTAAMLSLQCRLSPAMSQAKVACPRLARSVAASTSVVRRARWPDPADGSRTVWGEREDPVGVKDASLATLRR